MNDVKNESQVTLFISPYIETIKPINVLNIQNQQNNCIMIELRLL